MTETRIAIVRGQTEHIEQIKRYLPHNYVAEALGDVIVIAGVDHAGWTLDDYVIPRLASGLYAAREYVEKGE